MTPPSNTQDKKANGAETSPLFSTSETPTPPSSITSPAQIASFYPMSAIFKTFLLSGAYTITAHLASFLLKPFPFLFRDFVATIHPEDRFALPPTSQTTSEEEQNHVAIVTGSNTGIGFETASSLVEIGYDVILACRSRDKGENAARKINEMHANNQRKGKAIFLHPLDLSSLQSVRTFTEHFTLKYGQLNILVNNAGINFTGKSVDGMDLLFQTNFVGHYLLTRLLIPHLLKAKNKFPSNDGGINGNGVESGRVVNLSSVMHHFANASEKRRNEDGAQNQPNGVHDENWWKGCCEPSTSANVYAESKLAALMLTQELNRRYGSQGLRSVAANPGAVNSDIWRKYPSYMMKLHNLIYLTVKQGSSTSFAAAVGDLPNNAMYLQPYWQPWGRRKSTSFDAKASFQQWFTLPVPFTEMLGLYAGHAITDYRMPSQGSSLAMWNTCEKVVGL